MPRHAAIDIITLRLFAAYSIFSPKIRQPERQADDCHEALRCHILRGGAASARQRRADDYSLRASPRCLFNIIISRYYYDTHHIIHNTTQYYHTISSRHTIIIHRHSQITSSLFYTSVRHA